MIERARCLPLRLTSTSRPAQPRPAVSHLADVNLVLALVTDRHVHHRVATGWIDGVAFGSMVICRAVQMGLLRLLNNPVVMKEDVLPSAECWELWRRLLEDDRVRFEAAEPPGLDEPFERYTRGRTFSARLWSDAYLAAYARAAGHTLVTFNREFRSFPELLCTVLPPDQS